MSKPAAVRGTAFQILAWGLCVALLPRALPAQPMADARLAAEAIRLNEEAGRISVDGDVAEAIEVCRRAVEANRRVHGEHGRKTALAKSHLALAMSRAGDHHQSLVLWQQALDVAKKELGEEHQASLSLLENVASAYASLNQPAESAERYRQAIAIYQRTGREKSFDAASACLLLGNQQQALGDYSAARASFERSITLYRQAAGRDVAELVPPMNRLGRMLREQGDLAGAKRMFNESLRLSLAFHGENHVDTADAYNNVATALIEEGNFPAAADALGKALSIRVRVQGVEHPDVAFAFENTAVIFVFQRRYADAENALNVALEIRRKHREADPYLLSNVLSNLAVLHHRQGKSREAVAATREALQITAESIGDNHPLTFVQWENLASLQMAANDLEGARDSMEHVRRAIRRHVARVLPGLSDREQLQYLTTRYRQQLHHALSMACLNPDHSALANASAGWLINGKAITQESMADREQLLKRSAAAEGGAEVQRLFEVRKQLAAVSMGAQAASAKQQDILQSLEAEEAALSRSISQSLRRSEAFGQWVELETVREAIPAGAVLIDIARIEVYDFNNADPELTVEKFQPARYFAWIIPRSGTGNVRILDLGLASEIDALIGDVRSEISRAARADGLLQKQGEDAALRQLDPLLARVQARVWRPIAEQLPDAVESLIVSPDGELWLLPWAAIPVSEGRLLLEDYALRLVTSGRDLVSADSGAEVQATTPLLFADPDFDLSIDALRKAIQALFPTRELEPTRTRGTFTALANVLRLPNTKVEADFIAPSVEKIAGEPPRTYADRFALESVVKSVRAPRILVLSTHGFFLPERPAVRDAEPGGKTRSARSAPAAVEIENPLLRCGLLFAGCNSRQSTGSDDGILTGLEIVGIDLAGTELVVLSACETGIGKVNSGEGVAGLRQAFQLAGASSVVATLWQVPDRDSALLMNDFFAQLAAGQGRPEALRQAQLRRIAARRERYGAAHPFFWAAWTVTGR